MTMRFFNHACLAASSIFLLGLSYASAPAFDLTWPPPSPPAGTNPVEFPMPRYDWIGHFLGNIDHTRGQQVDLIFDGDSITDFWMGTGRAVWAEHYGSLHAFDFGISGDQVQHVLWRVEHGQVDGLKPKLIVLMIGTNNMGGDTYTPKQISSGVQVLIKEYEKRCPGAHILLLAIFPRAEAPSNPLRAKIIATNTELAKMDDGKTVTYLDFGTKLLQPDGTLSRDIMPDFLHPSAKGYEIWANAIQPVIQQYFPEAGATPAP